MKKYFEPTKDQIIMAFVASCIESVADRLDIGFREVFDGMERVGMIDEYIYLATTRFIPRAGRISLKAS